MPLIRWRKERAGRRFQWAGPEEVEKYLAASEEKWRRDLKKGVAKKIVWRRPDHRRTRLAVIYLHGFSASRRELTPIPERLAALLDANLFYTRLAGHGLPGDRLAAVGLDDWLLDAREAMAVGRHIGVKVLVMGMSTGAALGVWLAARHPARIAALILVSPNFGLRPALARLLPYRWGRALLRPLAGRERSWQPLNARHGFYWTTRYPLAALFPVGELIATVRALDPAAICQPVLMVVSPRDRLINARLAVKVFTCFKSRHNRLFFFNGGRDPDRHIPGGAIISPDGTDMIMKYIKLFLDEIPL